MVSFLVEHDANVNQADSEGWTPLHVAASCGYPDIAECVVYMSLQYTTLWQLCNTLQHQGHLNALLAPKCFFVEQYKHCFGVWQCKKSAWVGLPGTWKHRVLLFSTVSCLLSLNNFFLTLTVLTAELLFSIESWMSMCRNLSTFPFLQSQCCVCSFSFLLQQGASLSAVNCDGDVPLDIALDEATENLLQDYMLKQGECCSLITTHSVYINVSFNHGF